MTEQSSIFKRRPKTMLALIVCAGVLAGLVAVELSLSWIVSPGRKPVPVTVTSTAMRHVVLREHLPGAEIQTTAPYPQVHRKDGRSDKVYRLATDGNGFILPSVVHDKPDFNVVFLGGSSTECFYVDQDKRFPYVVGRLREAKLQRTVNTFNGGVSGNHTMHANIILTAKVLPMKPDVVVLMENMNDIGTLLILGGYWVENFSRGIVFRVNETRAPEPPISDWHLLLRALSGR